MKILITDFDFPDLELEHSLYLAAGIDIVTAQCRSEDEVIAAAACGKTEDKTKG